MKDHWHEQIQRYVSGQSSAEESAALQTALRENAELRALYLDYMNLDVALGAAAELAAAGEKGTDRIAPFPQPSARMSPHYWRWGAAAAACAAAVMLALSSRHRDSTRARPDLTATISSTQSAIARLSVEPPPPPLPAWMSPTASMLEEPRIPQ